MPTCPHCLQTAPRSREKLEIRLRNIARHPEISIAPCPRCGGTDWATTEEMIEIKPPVSSPPQHKFKAFLERWFG